MLKKIRAYCAFFIFILATLLFMDFTGTLHHWFGWVAKTQLVPAVLAINVVSIVILTILTLLFGRIYCSVICPLGIYQDLVSRIASKKKKNRFHYSPSKNIMRYSTLAVFVVMMVAGISIIVSLLDPYAIYGRLASGVFAPIYQLGNNILAYFAQKVDSYAFYGAEVWLKSITVLVVTLVTLSLVTVLAWRGGRTYCNTICPVGTFLGVISRFSVFKLAIDTEKCNSCGLCERNCKSSCIDSKTHSIDDTRCVTCFNCIDKCTKDAVKYVPRYGSSDKTVYLQKPVAQKVATTQKARRSFLSIAALFSITALVQAQEKKVEGTIAPLKERKVPKRAVKLSPAGSKGIKNFTNHCTACGLCISSCPNNVLRPSSQLERFMQPEMSFELGFCRPECTTCSEVCPTGAITAITKPEKSAIKIGSAVWIEDNCVVNVDKVSCGNCEKHCPTGAIQMIAKDKDDPKSLLIPALDNERCIGCGSCEYLCPARPVSAIYVDGIERHRLV